MSRYGFTMRWEKNSKMENLSLRRGALLGQPENRGVGAGAIHVYLSNFWLISLTSRINNSLTSSHLTGTAIRDISSPSASTK